jgi:tryptophan 2,3-dioxygenase
MSGCPMNAASDAENIVFAEDAQLDFSGRMSYGDYLQLDKVLSAQSPKSQEHDELLFIVMHQVSELWMKLLLAELREAISDLRTENLSPAFKKLARVSRIMEQLVHAWDVLSTMTPSEYTAFRPYLIQSSGFQSWQYRCIEFSLGNKNAAMLQPHAHNESLLDLVTQAYKAPSLYDESLRFMARQGLNIPESHLNRDWRSPYSRNTEVEQAWLVVYKEPAKYWELYQLGEKLVDVEDAFRLWRFRHVTTVERVIGFKRGTGGTGGISYLRKMLDVVLFPEVWSVRTHL